jgi:predicted transport protein
MSDIKLFNVRDSEVAEMVGRSVAVEKTLQELIERHLDTFLGVRFLRTEYMTGKKHGGRVDTLGIDENGCPVIIEYKRATNANVINQGLFYLDWLMDHKADFKLLVKEKLGDEASDSIEWSAPRLVCIAGDFTKYDEHAIQQIDRNIELIRYRRYDGLLLLELVNAATAAEPTSIKPNRGSPKPRPSGKGQAQGVEDYIERADSELRDLYESIKEFLLNMGDDVQIKMLKWYIAFKRIKNFACIEVHPNQRTIVVWVKLDPNSVRLEDGFTRDVSKVGHCGTGDLEITIRTRQDFEKAKPMLEQGYEAS